MRSLPSIPSPIRPLGIALALAGSLAACSTTTAAPKASAQAPVAAEPAPQIAMGCLEANAGWTLGQAVDDALVAKAKADAQASFVRVLRPGQPVTMEYNGARLNLHTNAKGMIERVSCG